MFIKSIEVGSRLKLNFLNFCAKMPLVRRLAKKMYYWPAPHKELFCADFPSPVGYSCGVDVNAEYISGLAMTGASFVEIGTIRPSGAPSHELQRLNKIQKCGRHYTIFNRKSNASKGVYEILNRLKKTKKNIIIAANIAKDFATDATMAKYDYEKCFSLLYDYVDMFVVNVTGATPEENQNLQDIDYLGDILDHLLSLRLYYDGYKPILVKIGTEIPFSVVDDIINYSMRSGIDGIIAGNAIRDFSPLIDGAHLSAREISKLPQGARLSGGYLLDRTIRLVDHIKRQSNNILPIIASGGVLHPVHAQALFNAGADLISVASAFYLEGTYAVNNILRGLYPKKKTILEDIENTLNNSID